MGMVAGGGLLMASVFREEKLAGSEVLRSVGRIIVGHLLQGSSHRGEGLGVFGLPLSWRRLLPGNGTGLGTGPMLESPTGRWERSQH